MNKPIKNECASVSCYSGSRFDREGFDAVERQQAGETGQHRSHFRRRISQAVQVEKPSPKRSENGGDIRRDFLQPVEAEVASTELNQSFCGLRGKESQGVEPEWVDVAFL